MNESLTKARVLLPVWYKSRVDSGKKRHDQIRFSGWEFGVQIKGIAPNFSVHTDTGPKLLHQVVRVCVEIE